MKAQLDLIGLVVEDMERSLAFYRELGLDVPADADQRPHVEATLPGGLRLAWDTQETIRSFLGRALAAALRAGAGPGRQRRRPVLPAQRLTLDMLLHAFQIRRTPAT